MADRRSIPAFPRAYSEVITHEIIPQASFHFHPTRRLRGHSPEVLRKARHLETRVTRTVSVSPLPRAVSAVTWCNSGQFGHTNPTLLTSPQRGGEDSKSRQTFPQAPRAVVVQSRKTQAVGSRHTGHGAAPALNSPRPQRIIASPRANLNHSASTAATSTFSSLVGCGAPERKAPAPIGAQPLSVRAQNSTSRASGQSFSERTPAQEAPELSYPSSDLDGLLRYIRDLDQKGLRMTEAVYSVNSWMLYGLIPLRHHGLILYSEGSRSCGKDPYLTLDFSSRGILWDTFDVYPDVPEGTFFSKTYKINMDPLVLRDYCKATQPFSWPDNDCKHWAKGVLLLMGIPDDPCADGAVDGISRYFSAGPCGLAGDHHLWCQSQFQSSRRLHAMTGRATPAK